MNKKKDDILLNKNATNFLEEMKKYSKNPKKGFTISESRMKQVVESEILRQEILKNPTEFFMKDKYEYQIGMYNTLEDFIDYWFDHKQMFGILDKKKIKKYIDSFLFSNHDSLTLCDREYITKTLKKFEEKIIEDGEIENILL
jgi:hypothetical protein